MITKVLIDNDIHGWRKEDEKNIGELYDKIEHVGSIPELPADSKDEKIGGYCLEHDYDLFTADKEAHVKFFRDARITSIQITKFSTYTTGNRPIYLLKIIK